MEKVDKGTLKKYNKEMFEKIQETRIKLSKEHGVPVEEISFRIIGDSSDNKDGSRLSVAFVIPPKNESSN